MQRRLEREDLDARMCKALSELPSDLGLEAVEKFATANLDTVRSKTGFMVSTDDSTQTGTVVLVVSSRCLPVDWHADGHHQASAERVTASKA